MSATVPASFDGAETRTASRSVSAVTVSDTPGGTHMAVARSVNTLVRETDVVSSGVAKVPRPCCSTTMVSSPGRT